jgi:integrase
MRVRQLAVLSAALTQAVSFWYLLDHNVLKDVKRPRFKPRDRLISDEEFEACKAIAPKKVRLAMMLALVTGQRQGDIISFKWTDIEDLAVPYVDERTKETVTMELNVLQSKTGKRIGIGITKQLEAILDECYRLKGGGHAGSEYILPTRTGKPYTSEGFRACWQRVMRQWMRLGNQNFHFHDIRALCATKCPTPEYAMKLLGHSNISMTLKVYRRGKERVVALST